MMFEPSRAKAVEKLDNFIENNLSEYSKLEILISAQIKDLMFHPYHLI